MHANRKKGTFKIQNPKPLMINKLNPIDYFNFPFMFLMGIKYKQTHTTNSKIILHT